MAYDNSNRGAIWKNKKKEKDTHPDFTGSQNVVCAGCGNAHDYWLSAWKRKDDAPDGAPVLSLSVKPKEARMAEYATAPKKPIKDDLSDEIPF